MLKSIVTRFSTRKYAKESFATITAVTTDIISGEQMKYDLALGKIKYVREEVMDVRGQYGTSEYYTTEDMDVKSTVIEYLLSLHRKGYNVTGVLNKWRQEGTVVLRHYIRYGPGSGFYEYRVEDELVNIVLKHSG